LSESQEPSYYEIALTNRQVLVAFVVLLACVLAAFFAGVWVGKGSPAAAVAADAAMPAETEPTPVAGAPEELTFFEQTPPAGTGNPPGRPDLDELAENPRPDSTLAADLGLEEPPAPTPAAVPPRGASAPAPAPGGAPAQPAGAPGAEPGSLFIQVFSSQDQAQAQRLTDRLKGAGFNAFLSPSGAMYRVRIGPFKQRRRALAEAERARRDFKVDTWITSSP
jgi:cell division septation protein DedD